MCGIVGYCGNREAVSILIEGLKKLEYRGYDSAGVAVRDGCKATRIIKSEGKLINLINKIEKSGAVVGTCGLGHTRWATHGDPNEINAHPHRSDDGNVVAVHNGIIENYRELKEKLEGCGYKFYSRTDTEVVIKLVDYYYKKYKVGPVDALAKTLVRVRGSYALAVMFKDYPGEIYAARKDSPMIVGINGGECFVASDVPAILPYTRQVYYVGNLQMAKLSGGKATFYNLDGIEVSIPVTKIEWSASAAEKGGFEHFMIKEIHEQPKAVSDTIANLLKGEKVDLGRTGLTERFIKGLKKIHIVACGSAYNVGAVLQYVMEDLARIPVRCEFASEFRYRNPILDKDSLVIAISQSGETADTLAAIREARERGVKTLAIVNVRGSSIEREADYILPTLAGPEIAVATTKAYSAQLAAGYLLCIEFARIRGEVSEERYKALLNEIISIPQKIEEVLKDKTGIQQFASNMVNAKDIFFIGRGIDYAAAMEGSLKCKEVSYIHSEAYAAGELKHGTISLVERGTVVFGILTQPRLVAKTACNMEETKSRGAFLAEVSAKIEEDVAVNSEFCVKIPAIYRYFSVSLVVIYMQLFAYYLSVFKGLDVDKPRNLAKSVTVE